MPPLDWSKSITMTQQGQSYSIDIAFTTSVNDLEFKFVLFNDDQNPTWESTPNRTLILPDGSGGNQVSYNKWNQEQIVDISSLKKINVEGLQEDFQLIEAMVLEVHPGTYRYNNQDEISDALAELKTKFGRPISRGEAYLAISKLTAQLKCDHTKAGFNNQNRIINSIIHYQKDKIPFTFCWVDEEMIVLYNASENSLLRRGTKVIAINDTPVVEIRNEMIKYIGADGATDQNRVYKTQVNGYDFRHNAFDIFYPLLYPINQEKITLNIQSPGQKENRSIEVRTLTCEERSRILTDRYNSFPESRDDMVKFEVH